VDCRGAPRWRRATTCKSCVSRARCASKIHARRRGPGYLPRPDSDSFSCRSIRLFGAQPSAVNLYRVFEVIRENTKGEDHMVKNGWTTKPHTGRFRHTMNSVAALGAEARHGVEPTTPPTNPMSMLEAREFIQRLLALWLRSK
jgi:hypothetical protein